ncbi:MAG: FxsA family protein [Proteobacteria bacterium]|nr:FxsA family protein [Pseudomonadota bacterium]
MFVVLLLLFTVIPAIEIGLFVVVGSDIGPAATIAVVIFTGFAGASLARFQGTRVLTQIQEAMARGAIPTDELIEGALVLFGGALLLTPGFLTDAWGIACLLPPSRKLFALGVKRYFARRVTRTGPGRAEMKGFHMWTGGVRPGPAAKEKKIDLGIEEPATNPGPRTIDASFSVVPEPPEDP